MLNTRRTFLKTAGLAIHREKQIKGGSRQKKIDLINAFNADWNDLSVDWFANDEIASVVPPKDRIVVRVRIRRSNPFTLPA